MKNITVELVTMPDFDVPGMIGGLAALTQHKREFKQATTEAGLKLMKHLVDMGHTSLFECADFGFIFSSASRIFLSQITRHRLASYTSGSQQYQDHDNFPFVIPESIRNHPDALDEYTRLMEKIDESYGVLKAWVGKDDARYVLPGAAANHLYAKFNLRELIDTIMPQRLCRRNTPESLLNMRLMAKALIASGFRPCIELGGCSCVRDGFCDQGKMTCGKPFKNWEDMIYGD